MSMPKRWAQLKSSSVWRHRFLTASLLFHVSLILLLILAAYNTAEVYTQTSESAAPLVQATLINMTAPMPAEPVQPAPPIPKPPEPPKPEPVKEPVKVPPPPKVVPPPPPPKDSVPIEVPKKLPKVEKKPIPKPVPPAPPKPKVVPKPKPVTLPPVPAPKPVSKPLPKKPLPVQKSPAAPAKPTQTQAQRAQAQKALQSMALSSLAASAAQAKADDAHAAQLQGIEDKYLALIQQTIRANWINPFQAGQYQVTLAIRLDPEGNVVSVSVIQSSGNEVFDRQVMYAVRKSSPLPLPKEAEVVSRLSSMNLVFS